MLNAIFVGICTLTVTLVSMLLIFHRQYEDGLFGRIALAMIAMAAVARFAHIVGGGLVNEMSPIAVLLWAGIALFFVRHAYRFMRWRTHGDHDWRNSRRMETGGKCL